MGISSSVSSSSSAAWADLAGAGAGVEIFLEVVRGFLAGCSSSARNGDAASVVERRRRLFVAGAGVAAGAGVDVTASGRVAGCCALLRELDVSFVDFDAFEAAALRGVARVRLLRVSTVITSSVISVVAAVRRVRRVDIALQ